MKKQTRIRRNGSPRAATPQAKTPSLGEPTKNPTKEAKYTDEAQCWCELEFSVQQAIGCIHLLDERLGQMLALNSIEEESSQAAGIFHIASQTSERLYRAFHASFKMYHPKAAHEA